MKRMHVIGLVCLLLGVSLWGHSSVQLRNEGHFDYRPNVLTLKGSPFGRTIAIAMRGPVDRYFNHGVSHTMQHDSGAGCSHPGCGSELCGHAGADHEGESLTGSGAVSESEGLGQSIGLLARIDAWNAAYYSRTNPFGSTKVHQTYLMGETQKRLRLSYEMDPANFAAYGSYYLFLSEALSSLKDQGAEDELERQAIHAALALSENTVRYCLTREDEPSAMLTAAAAAHDFIQMRYRKGGEGMVGEMIAFLKVKHQSLTSFEELRAEMAVDGRWEGIPALRRQEMDLRSGILKKFLKADAELVEREIKEEGKQQQVTSS